MPLVLLHGNFGSWTHWVRNIPMLAETHKVIVPDLPGFGESDTPAADIDAAGLGGLLASSYRELGQSLRPVIVGFSLGSTLAGAMAEAMGEETAHLVIVSAGQVGARRQEIPRFMSWRKAEDEEGRLLAHATNLKRMMLAGPEAVDDLAVHIQAANASRARLDTRPITAAHPLKEILPSLKCLISGVWGAEDATIGPYMEDRFRLMADLGRQTHVHVIEKAGHWVQFEQSTDFNNVLLDFIERDYPHNTSKMI